MGFQNTCVHVTANNSTTIHIRSFKIHGTMWLLITTTTRIPCNVGFSTFPLIFIIFSDFQKSSKIMFYNNYYTLSTMSWTREKIYCVTSCLETKSFNTVSQSMLLIIMIRIYYRDRKLNKIDALLEVDIIIIQDILIWCLKLKGCTFTEDVPNDHHCALVLVINHYRINGLHLFCNTQHL